MKSVRNTWTQFLILAGGISFPALAEGPATTGGFPQSQLTQFLPLIVIFGIFYFLLIRPQQKKAKLTAQFQTELKRGDMVITNSGIVGVVKAVGEKLVTLEIDDGVCFKILRNQVLENANALKESPKPA